MSKDRDRFVQRLESLSDKPNTVIRICLEQFDAKTAAELTARELRHQCDAQAVLYRELQGRYTAMAKEAESYRGFFAGYEAKLAALTETCAELRKRYETAAGENDLLKQAHTDLARQYVGAVEAGRQTQEKLDAAMAENKSLHDRIRALQEQVALSNRERFGAGTEKTTSVFGRTEVTEDPLDETAADNKNKAQEGTGKAGDYSAKTVLKKLAGKKGCSGGKPSSTEERAVRPKGKRKADFSRMDQINHYNYDLEKLDSQYGKGSYRIINFKCKSEIRETRII